MVMSQRGYVLRALAMALLVCTLSAALLSCSGSAPPPAAAPPTSPIPSSPPPEPPVSPFTGLATDLGAPVLGVKIDNAAAARPQTGLDLADLVYIEPVEGGLSRLLAVYQSRFPPVVGPVRSTRLTDLQLLANFGRPALAFSGDAAEVGALLARAPVLDVSEEKQPRSYRRDWKRPEARRRGTSGSASGLPHPVAARCQGPTSGTGLLTSGRSGYRPRRDG
jgi:hypothetical protein